MNILIKNDLIFSDGEQVVCEQCSVILKCGLYKYSDKRIGVVYVEDKPEYVIHNDFPVWLHGWYLEWNNGGIETLEHHLYLSLEKLSEYDNI
jgi:hypothetical protein